MNPFTRLQTELCTECNGSPTAEALRLLAPHWEIEYADDGKGRPAKLVILNKIQSLPPGRLVTAMESFEVVSKPV